MTAAILADSSQCGKVS